MYLTSKQRIALKNAVTPDTVRDANIVAIDALVARLRAQNPDAFHTVHPWAHGDSYISREWIVPVARSNTLSRKEADDPRGRITLPRQKSTWAAARSAG